MNCENCNNIHDGTYGSGRFCSTICARSFSTKNNREIINDKISKKLLAPNNKWITVKCKNPKCKKKFESKKSADRKYCCDKCARSNRPKTSIIAKEHMSIARTKFLQENNSYNCGYYEFNINGKRLVVQGTWEKLMAERLISLNIKWDRTIIKYGHRRYTPDFYLPEYNMYIEVKGFMRDRDKTKMWKVIEEHDIDIILVEALNEIYNFDISNLKMFKSTYPKNSINFAKFENHWYS